MRSLRTSLIIGTTTATALVLVLAGVLLYLSVRTHLLSQFDYALLDKARLLASAIEREVRKLDLGFKDLDMREFRSPDHGGYLQLWWPDGRVLYRSESLGQADLQRITPRPDQPSCVWIPLPNKGRARATVLIFRPRSENEKEEDEVEEDEEDLWIQPAQNGETLTLVLARDARPIFEALALLRSLLFGLGFAAIAVCSITLWIVVSRKLRPLATVARQISQLSHTDLSERIAVAGTPWELEPVVFQFNDLLARLEAAFQREREFTGDVAHELRTPLSGLRTTLEVAISRVRDPEDYEKAASDCLEIIGQMQRMTENLLLLTRLDSGRVEITKEKVWLNKSIQAAFRQFTQEVQTRRLEVHWSLGPDSEVTTDPSLLALILRNVLENAVIYANEGGTISIESTIEQSTVGILVSNTGSTLSADQAQQVFQRYWRHSPARSETVAHCGLGLSMVKKITAVLGGTVEARSDEKGVFCISIRFPAA